MHTSNPVGAGAVPHTINVDIMMPLQLLPPVCECSHRLQPDELHCSVRHGISPCRQQFMQPIVLITSQLLLLLTLFLKPPGLNPKPQQP